MSEDTHMSDVSPEQPLPPPAAPAVAPSRTRGGGLALGVAVAALGVSGVLGWQWFEMRGKVDGLRQELAQRLVEGDTVAKEARGIARQGQEGLAALQGKVGAIEGRLADSEGQAAALEALYQEYSRSRDDRVLAEVEQAVMLASQQLQLAGNVEAALVALQGAESRLALVDQARLQSLRKALAKDIEQLRSVPALDVAGLSIKLELLQGAVDSLPLAFAGEARPKPADTPVAESPPGEQSPMNFLMELGRELWREFSALVRVERLDGVEPALLAPAQGAYLRESLKIRLLSARLNLLSRDGRAFSEDMVQSGALIARYFDLRQPAVQLAQKELQDLAAVKIPKERPAINESLVALGALQNRQPVAQPARPAPR